MKQSILEFVRRMAKSIKIKKIKKAISLPDNANNCIPGNSPLKPLDNIEL